MSERASSDKSSADRFDLATRLIHPPGAGRDGGAAVPAIQRSTVWEVGQAGLDSAEGKYPGLRYPRYNDSPGHVGLSRQLADLENADDGLVTASGMAAISAALLSHLDSGDHVLVSKDLYGGTHGLVTKRFPGLGIEHDMIDPRQPGEWDAKVRPTTRAIYVETLGNPLVSLPDLEAVVSFAGQHGLTSMIDNTFATPIYFRPLDHGFDLVVHSATKYLNGHSDVLAGAIVGRAEPMAKVDGHMRLFGGTPDAEACFLLQRGLRTLALRLEAQSRNALSLATFLEGHPAVDRVLYPGLESHPDHARAQRLLEGYGAMLAFEVKGGWPAARRFLEGVRLACHAPSLGGVETLVVSPAKSSHAGVDPDERRRLGIADGLIRVSVGIEAWVDIEADFASALAAGEA